MGKNKYFDEYYSNKIIKLLDEKMYEDAICEFHKYIAIYPEDLAGYYFCANAYMILGDLESAEKMLDSAIITKTTSEASKEQFIMFKVNLLCLQEKYYECLTLLKENINVFKKNHWNYVATLLYLKKKLRIIKECDYEFANKKYLFSQILNYNEEDAIFHIQKHTSFDNNDTVVEFVDSFSINDIYYKLRDGLILKNKNKVYNGSICCKHIFKYELCGHVDGKLVDFFEVVTLKDTNEIITMYPYKNKEKRECIDLTPVVKEEPKVKRLSQIDKFNQRYSKK